MKETVAISFVKILRKEFSKHSDATVAPEMEAYMRNQFRFMGIKKPVREQLLRPYFSHFAKLDEQQWPEVISQLWDSPYRELQYAAMELCRKRKKDFLPEHLSLFRFMICKNSWWDTVDFIAANLVGDLLRQHPELTGNTVNQWSNSGNLWLQRTCILFQLKYGKATDRTLLFSLCTRFAGEQDFFIRKAIGWALRQYSKTEPVAVRTFVKKVPLSPLSLREASKYI
jgi:3-methyladenine DNA glycosylase AlkD